MFSESARAAKGTFQYLKTRHTELFWEALAFIIVKGITERMPPLLTAGNINPNPLPMPSSATASVDTLGDMFHALSVTPSSSSRISSPSLTSSHSASFLPSSTGGGEVSPLIYSHVRNLHGILSSNYYQTPTSRVEDLAQPLGPLAAQYLVSHRYGPSDVTKIVRIHRLARDNNQFVMDLVRCGMAIAEARFLLVLIAQYIQSLDTN